MKKYIPLTNNMFEYIRNRITVGAEVNDIISEVMKRYSPELTYYRCDDDMVREFVTQLVHFAYYVQNNELYLRP